MNIVTPQPAINLNTANVYTETAARDNQLREVIPKPAPVSPSLTDNKSQSDADKAKAPVSDEGSLYDSTGKTEDSKQVNSREEDPSQNREEQKQEQKQEQQEEQAAQEEQVITELKARDQEVRLHEQAHARVGGQYAGSPSYEYQRGPDGNNYAVGGEVMIDVAPIPGDPQGTIDKMQQVRAAALAPAEPSGADRAIAADATQKMSAAQAELAKQSITGEVDEDNNNQVQTFESRRLSGEVTAAKTEEEAALESDPFAVAMPSSRAAEIEARAARLGEFYQQSTTPKATSNLSVQI